MKSVLLSIALFALGCQSLPDVEPGVCGNKVIEEGEDCDGFAPEGARCGAAGTATGCFFVCDAGDLAASPCPEGYGCGADGRCRRASGEFTLASQLSFPVPAFEVADIDGDGAPDLIGSSQNRLHVAFGDGGGGIANQLDFPSAADRGLFSLGDLDGDGRTDIVAATDAGITAFLGRLGQGLEPVTYPSFRLPELESTRLFVARGRFGAGADQERLFGILDAGADGAAVIELSDPVGEPAAAEVTALFGAGFDVGAVFTPLAAGRTDPDENDELALTHAGASSVWILDLDAGISQRQIAATAVALPSPFRAAGRPFLADFDGDGDLDVVLRMRDSTNGEVAVGLSSNNGLGSFGAVTLASDRSAEPIELLEVARLDGDAFADFVFSTGAMLGDGGPINVFDALDVVVTGDWNAGAIVDLNADDRADLVAVPEAAPGVEVHLQTPGGLFNRFIVGSSAFFQGNGEVLAGDFDGDFIRDVALTARRPGAGAQLEVLFGSPGGGFDEPVEMARFEGIEQLMVVGTLESQGPDGIDDLIVLGAQAGSDVVATMQGDSSRSMVSPLFLVEADVELEPGSPEDVTYVPLQAVIGRVGDTVGVISATVSLGRGAASQPEDCSLPFFGCSWAWALPGLGDGQLDAAAASIAPLEIPGNELGCHLWQTADLDGGGDDELIGVTSNRLCPGLPPEAGFVSLAGGDRVLLEAPAPDAGLGEFTSGDLDGDGAREIAIGFRGSDGAGGVAVYWNQEGGFAAPELLDAGPVLPLSVALGRLDGDAFGDLVFTGVAEGAGGLPEIHVALYDPGTGGFAAPELRADLGRGLAVAVADFNGDGVFDVAVGDGVGASIYLGAPAPPAGSASTPEEGS